MIQQHRNIMTFMYILAHTPILRRKRRGIEPQGIQQLTKEGVKLVFTYGDPNYYSKVGFRAITEEIAKAPLELSQPEGWLCQSLVGDEIEPIAGNSYCVEALNKPEYW